MKFRFNLIHLEALVVYLIYTLGTKFVFLRSLGWENSLRYYLPGPFISALFGVLFLYLFSHEDFFEFAKEVEAREQKAEKKWRQKFIHTGKVLAVLLIATLSGPLLAALTTRFLFRYSKAKYLTVFLACVLGSFLIIFIAKGGISLLFR